MSEWYYAKNGNQHGPVTFEDLYRNVQQGLIGEKDLVYTSALSYWQKAGDVPELAAALAAVLSQAPSVMQPVAPALESSRRTVAPVQPLAYQQPFNRTGQLILTERALDMLRQTGPWVRLFGVLIFIGVGLGAIAVAFMLLGALFSLSSGTGAGAGGGIFMIVMALIQGIFLLLYFMPGLYLNRYASKIGELLSTRREDVAEQALEAQKSFWKFMGILFLISIVMWVLVIILFAILGVATASGVRPAPGYRPTPS